MRRARSTVDGMKLPPAIFAARPILSDHDQMAAALVFRALSHPQRLRLVRELSTGPKPLRELRLGTRIEPTEHLKVLQAAGIVQAGPPGWRGEWTLVDGVLERIAGLLA